MFIFTERHGDGLPRFSGSSHHGGGGIGAPSRSVRPSSECHQGDIRDVYATAPCDSPWHTKSRASNAFSLQHLQRQQALDELLNDIREWRSASHPALRAFWRTLALHDIARFKRDHLQPERAAFSAAVERSKQRIQREAA